MRYGKIKRIPIAVVSICAIGFFLAIIVGSYYMNRDTRTLDDLVAILEQEFVIESTERLSGEDLEELERLDAINGIRVIYFEGEKRGTRIYEYESPKVLEEAMKKHEELRGSFTNGKFLLVTADSVGFAFFFDEMDISAGND